MNHKTYSAALIIFISLAMAGGAYAERLGENDAMAISEAKISLGQAIAIAERHVGGKASQAEIETHKDHWVFDVEVVKGSSVSDVKVDAGNGKVIEVAEDKTDHDDSNDLDD